MGEVVAGPLTPICEVQSSVAPGWVGHRIGKGGDYPHDGGQPQQAGQDHRSQPRWSAGKKTDAVLRLLRGESLEELSHELKFEAPRLAAWPDDFLAIGKQGPKAQRPDRSPDDRALKQAEHKTGQLTLENDDQRMAEESA